MTGGGTPTLTLPIEGAGILDSRFRGNDEWGGMTEGLG